MKLSIITINRNNAQGLRKTIESVVSQTFTDFEYIVIDGASTDGSVEVIKEFSNHIHYWVSEPDKGIYNAMNKGIMNAHGEYLLFLNSGDWLFDNYSVQNVFSENSNSSIIYGNSYVMNQNHIVRFGIVGDLKKYELLYSNFAHQGLFLKKKLFDLYGLYDETYQLLSDWKFNFDLVLIKGIYAEYLDIDVSINDSPGISNNVILSEYEQKKIWKEYFPTLVNNNLNLLIEEIYNYNILKEQKYILDIENLKKSKAYRLGHFMLKPISIIKKKFK